MLEVQGPIPHVLSTRDATIKQSARKLESTFLAEMLKNTGMGESKSAFGGGVGEEQFSSFLHMMTAERMVDAGGVGLAKIFYNKIMELYESADKASNS